LRCCLSPDVLYKDFVEILSAPSPSHSNRLGQTLTRGLNPSQIDAVTFPAQPLLVIAGAGSGKTRVITCRLARLIDEGADPRRIFAVTFTNKAAREMKERVAHLLGYPGSDLPGMWLGTFHGLSARLLRLYGEAVGIRKDFVIYDSDDSRRLMARVLRDLNISEKTFPVRQVLAIVDHCQNQGISAEGFVAAGPLDEVIAKAYRTYEERLAASNAVDFGGLLLWALRLGRAESSAAAALAERFDHILVDEFQDTNSVQYRLVRFLSRRTGSITVVGDEDQSIYGWRGADIRNILDFERDHPGAGVIKLEQNYRSTKNILRAANAVIAPNTERRPKRLFTDAGAGDPVVVFEGETEREEAEYVASTVQAGLEQGSAPRDFAVFYRTNGQSRVLEEALRTRNIPYVVVGGTRFYDRAEIKDLIAYLRVLQNPDDAVGLSRIINVPARGIGDTTVDRLSALARDRGVALHAALEIAATEHGILGQGPRNKVAAFCELMKSLRAAKDSLPPAALAEKVLEDSGYRDQLAGENSIEAEGRLENLMELVAQMREYERETEEPTLADFLERITLASDVDSYDPEKGAVALMTVHTAKGLEFPEVLVVGLEEGVFPHQRSIDDDNAVQEERRLCYVAVTRAMKRLHLCRVRWRRLSGQQLGGVPSRFLGDLPAEVVNHLITPRPAYDNAKTEGAGPWQGRWNRGESPGMARARASTPAAPAARPGEITRHYDQGMAHGEEGELGLRIGAKLKHAKFGVGEVRAWQSVGDDFKVTVRFASVGVKTVMAKFLQRV
jgi:DNA helicase-2/ATP-dependent DNA helicase PcrA